MEVEIAKINGYDFTERQGRMVASRAIENLQWLDKRLADLDQTADLFAMDTNGRRTPTD